LARRVIRVNARSEYGASGGPTASTGRNVRGRLTGGADFPSV
jgi:hypothetical protein